MYGGKLELLGVICEIGDCVCAGTIEKRPISPVSVVFLNML